MTTFVTSLFPFFLSNSECTQVRLFEFTTPAIPRVCTGHGRHLLKNVEKPSRDPSSGELPRGGILSPTLLLPFALSKMDLLPEGTSTASTQRCLADHHPRFLSPEPQCCHDQELEACRRGSGIPSVALCQGHPPPLHGLPEGLP